MRSTGCVNMFRCFTIATALLLLGRPLSADDGEPLPEYDLTEFTRIFDGETLDGWDGDPTYWTVRDGCLVGTVTPETLLAKNSWIVWRGGLVEDFELVLDYRVSADGNSGVGYRLAVLEDDPFSVRGPQADIQGGDMFTGICYEENGRRLLAARGQSTWIKPDSLPLLFAQWGNPEELQSVVRKEEWNRYRLVVEGSNAQHFINGEAMSEVFDDDDANRMHSGLLGVQVHVGPPMTIEFRDIFLKHLGDAPEGSAERGDVTYRSGTLSEPEHQVTFENLATQAAQLTAASPTRPLEGETELEFDSCRLSVVRTDLVDVALYGESAPLNENLVFDLVIRADDRIIRIPDSRLADRILGPPPVDTEYRIKLHWNTDRAAWQIDSLEAIDDNGQ